MWLVASYCISFFQEKQEKIWRKTKMQMLLFSWYFFFSLFWVLYCMYFLSKRPTNVTLCYMNVCVLIYLWFAKMKIWSMLQVSSQENEKKKKLQRTIAYVFVWSGKVCLYGGISGSKEGQKVVKPQDYKGSIWGAHWAEKNFMLIQMLPCPLHDVTAVLPQWSCSTVIWPVGNAVNTKIWTKVPLSHRSGISMTSLCFKS